MSFVISKKQYLAPTEARAQYEPLIFEAEGVSVERIDVNFGHPLYTTVSDIFHVKASTDEEKVLPIIPDGCMSMVFKGKEDAETMDGYVCGTTDEIKKIDVFPGDYYIFIRFLPGVGHLLMNEDAGKFTDKSLSLRENAAGGEQILSILERDTPLVERIRLVSKVLRIHMQKKTDQYLVKYCTERIFQNQGNLRIETLAKETGFTARYIGKVFERCVGISPKLYSQIIRLQVSMKRIIENDDDRLVDIAVSCGFFDHAHMNRVYKKLIRCSSGEFRKNLLNKLDYDQIEGYISVE